MNSTHRTIRSETRYSGEEFTFAPMAKQTRARSLTGATVGSTFAAPVITRPAPSLLRRIRRALGV